MALELIQYEIRQLIDDLKTGTEQFRMQQGRIVSTYSEIIGSLDQTQEDYGETLKFFLQKLQKDMKPLQSVNVALHDLLNTANRNINPANKCRKTD